MALTRLDHFSVRTSDVEGTRSFYEEILGLRNGPRPAFPFPGVWLYQGERAVVHVIGVDPNDSSGLQDYLGARGDGGAGSGNFDHIAFTADDLDGMRRHFAESGIVFSEREVPGLSLHQIFLKDPNGLTVELNFAA
ncbi:MAG: VOC family protein [Hyphomicrobiales bacterium]|nr:VOC family protein [Hyphomicrobiales bacterium]